jgi:hypothetical protein
MDRPGFAVALCLTGRKALNGMPWSTFIDRKPVNFRNTHQRAVLPLLAIGILALPAISHAQAPRYVPPPPPTKHTTVELRLRYLIQPDISFDNFGSVPFLDSYERDGNVFDGTNRTILYDDGALGQDFIRTTLIEGAGENREWVPSPNGDATANFSFQNPEHVDPAAPDDLVLEGSGSGAMGWELNYTKYLNRTRNLGFQVGFSFTGFDSRFNDTIDADLYVQEFKHRMADGVNVPDLPDPIENDDGTVIQPPYNGDLVRDDAETGDLLEWIAFEENEEMIPEGAAVDSRADLRSSVYNFRAGPTYALSMGERFSFNLGAGVSAAYFSGRFSAYEILMITPEGSDGVNPSRGLTTTEDAEWQVGGYVDANAYYHLSERINVFSGMQVQSGSTYTQLNEEREASVDFSSQIYVHAGMGIRF